MRNKPREVPYTKVVDRERDRFLEKVDRKERLAENACSQLVRSRLLWISFGGPPTKVDLRFLEVTSQAEISCDNFPFWNWFCDVAHNCDWSRAL
jgi:hypothetical protein